MYLENNKLKYIESRDINVDNLNHYETIHYKDFEFDKGGMSFVKMFRCLKSLNVYTSTTKNQKHPFNFKNMPCLENITFQSKDKYLLNKMPNLYFDVGPILKTLKIKMDDKSNANDIFSFVINQRINHMIFAVDILESIYYDNKRNAFNFERI